MHTMRRTVRCLGPNHSGDGAATVTEHRPDGEIEGMQLWLPLTLDGGTLAHMRIGQLVVGGLGVKVKVQFCCPRCDTEWTEDVILWNANLHPCCTLTELDGMCYQCDRQYDEIVMIDALCDQFYLNPDVLIGGPF